LPIFKTKRQHITRFDAEEWGRVAALLLAAMANGRINWKNLQPQIGGGHPISTLKDWCQHLKKGSFWLIDYCSLMKKVT
jgi:hypothetical protein